MDIVNLAFDFGASSGRLMMSKYNGEKIELEEIHRFSNEPVWLSGRYYWDFLRLFHELKMGLKKVASMDVEVGSIGIDTWGVDYAFIDSEGHILSNPIHYRDNRGEGMLEEIEKDTGIKFDEIYKVTGIQGMPINSLYQLYYDMKYRPHIVENAEAILFMPDLFSYALTGKRYNEYTMASTSQMLDAKEKNWAIDLLKKMNLPVKLLQSVIKPGTEWGTLSKEIQEEVGLGPIPVIAVGSHDTASAVAATPLASKNSAYLSCGTWSLLGVELDYPVVNENSYKHNFTNEGGVEGKIRYLKNITGLWIIQNLRKKWLQSDPNIGFGEISNLAKEANHIDYSIDPNHDYFVAPFDMEETIVQYCQEELNKKPNTIGEIARVAYNGIAREYKRTVDAIEETCNIEVDYINMVGGGIQDKFLCQMTANATGKKVLAGPIEASVLGNIIMQLKALNCIETLEEGRKLVKNSFEIMEYEPK